MFPVSAVILVTLLRDHSCPSLPSLVLYVLRILDRTSHNTVSRSSCVLPIPKSGRQSQPCVQRIQSVRICLYSPESGRQPQPCVRRIWTVRILQCSPLCPEDPECPDPPVESLVYMGDSPNPVFGGFGLSGSYSAVMSLGDSLSPVSGSSCTILSLGDSPNPMSGSSCAVPSMEDGPSPMSGGSGLSTSSYMYQVRILRLYTYNHSNF